eukprot:1063125-Pleurochrysis_carterae.AAC.1
MALQGILRSFQALQAGRVSKIWLYGKLCKVCVVPRWRATSLMDSHRSTYAKSRLTAERMKLTVTNHVKVLRAPKYCPDLLERPRGEK